MCQFIGLFLVAFCHSEEMENRRAMELVRCAPNVADRSTNRPAGTKWGYYYFLLLLDAHVQTELHLTQRQFEALDGLKSEFFDRPAMESKSGAAPDRAKAPAKKGAATTIPSERPGEIIGLLGNKAVALLGEEQKRRLGQIVFQLREVEVFFYPEVARHLDLSAEQAKALAAMRLHIHQEATRLHARYVVKENDPQQFQRRSVRLLKKGRLEFVKTFTSEQTQKLEVIRGKEISFDQTNLKFEIRQGPRGKATQKAEGADRSPALAR